MINRPKLQKSMLHRTLTRQFVQVTLSLATAVSVMTRLLGLLKVVLWRATTVLSLGSREARLRVAENMVSVSFLGCFVTSSSSSVSVRVCSDQTTETLGASLHNSNLAEYVAFRVIGSARISS